MTFLANSNIILQILMPRPLKRGILGASTIFPVLGWTAIDKYAYMCGSNFYESDFTLK